MRPRPTGVAVRACATKAATVTPPASAPLAGGGGCPGSPPASLLLAAEQSKGTLLACTRFKNTAQPHLLLLLLLVAAAAALPPFLLPLLPLPPVSRCRAASSLSMVLRAVSTSRRVSRRLRCSAMPTGSCGLRGPSRSPSPSLPEDGTAPVTVDPGTAGGAGVGVAEAEAATAAAASGAGGRLAAGTPVTAMPAVAVAGSGYL